MRAGTRRPNSVDPTPPPGSVAATAVVAADLVAAVATAGAKS